MMTSQQLDNSEQQKARQQQSLGDVQVAGDSNNFNAIQANIVTLTQNKIIQISANEIKTRKFIEVSPYKGLKSFYLKDKDQFFGRDQFIAGLVDELEHTNFVLLLGASGSGKSSVVRAGLIPWLAEKWGSQWFNLTLTPDRDPFDSLYSSLRSHFKQSEVQFVRAGTDQSLGKLVKKLKQPDSFWFIFIDQLEELFTISDSEKRDRFITSLASLCKEHEGDRTLKIVATMRADFLNRLDTNPANLLADATKGHRPLITQMHPDELRLAIEQPAAHHGVVFETGLVKTIIKDVQGQAGYLSLLQYTLDMLWKEEIQYTGLRDRTLSLKCYYRIGGVRGALQRHMDQIYQGFSPQEQAAAQRIFLRLVGIGGDTTSETAWKPVRKREVRSQFRNREEQAVLTQLIDANLLVSDTTITQEEASATRLGQATGATVEITHEILLMSWKPLKKWIKENRQAIALRNRLNDDVIQWKITNSEDELWTGLKLQKVLALQESPAFNQVLGGFSPDARAFIKASASLKKGTKQRSQQPQRTQLHQGRPQRTQPQRTQLHQEQPQRIQQQKCLEPDSKARKVPQKNHLFGKVTSAVMLTLVVFFGVQLKQQMNQSQNSPIASSADNHSNAGAIDFNPSSNNNSSPSTSNFSKPSSNNNSNLSANSNNSPSASSPSKPSSNNNSNLSANSNNSLSTSSLSKPSSNNNSNLSANSNAGPSASSPSKPSSNSNSNLSASNHSSPSASNNSNSDSSNNLNQKSDLEKPTAPATPELQEPSPVTPKTQPPAPGWLTIGHTQQGASSGHTDTVANYISWDGSNWTVAIDSKGRFTHTEQGASSSHDDTIINYITWDGSEWTATIDPLTNLFTHTLRGTSSSHTDTVLNYITWDGSNWSMRLE
ncbi:MAG: hypothetical protein AAF171_06595 [Cyanobacteria bacterium P01_A01_bin.116]